MGCPLYQGQQEEAHRFRRSERGHRQRAAKLEGELGRAACAADTLLVEHDALVVEQRAQGLAQVFRAKYLDALRRAFAAHQLVFAGSTTALAAPTAFAAWLAELRSQPWVVYAKRPFAGPEQVLDYLGHYTHRVALSNHRLVSLTDGVVRFRWKDYADGDRVKIMALTAEEFLRRFLLHVVPRGFVRIRHFGFLANRTRHPTLARCRELLAPPSAPATPREVESVHALMLRLTGLDIDRCPRCRDGRLRVIQILLPTDGPAHAVPITDTS